MSKIIGRTTATPVPRSDWNQIDETKVDFIKNKPTNIAYISEEDNENITDVETGEVLLTSDVVQETGNSVTKVMSQNAVTNAINETRDFLFANAAYITPQMFGAVGDGVADDTEAFRLALEHPCYIPSGTYLITDTLTVSHNIIGEGRGVATLKASSGLTVLSVADKQNINISGFGIIGTGTSASTGTGIGIKLNYVRNSNFSDLYFTGLEHAIYCEAQTWTNVFENCNIFKCTNGFYSDNTNSDTLDTTNINNCYIGTCTTAFNVGWIGVHIYGGWIEKNDAVFKITPTDSFNGISCFGVDFEKNKILLDFSSTANAHIRRLEFEDCVFYNFEYWFRNISTALYPELYFKVTGGNIGKPTVALFTEDSTTCTRFGTNLSDFYIEETSPYHLYQCDPCNIATFTIPADVIKSTYIFPEQIFMREVQLPAGVNAIVWWAEGGVSKNKTIYNAGKLEYRWVNSPCKKIQFVDEHTQNSVTPTEDIGIYAGRSSNILDLWKHEDYTSSMKQYVDTVIDAAFANIVNGEEVRF